MPLFFFPQFYKASGKPKSFKLGAHDIKLRLLAHSQSFLANQKARNAIVGTENLLIKSSISTGRVCVPISMNDVDTFDPFIVPTVRYGPE